MGFRRIGVVLAIVVTSFVVGLPAMARAGVPGGWRTVTYHGVILRVPAAWKVLNLSRHPAACPRLNAHVVYLGMPGPDPSCPAGAVGRAEAVWIRAADPASPDAIQATAATTVSGQAGRTDPGGSVHQVIADILPTAGAEVSIYDGGDPALARRIRASIRLTPAAGSRGSARAARSGRESSASCGSVAPSCSPVTRAPSSRGGSSPNRAAGTGRAISDPSTTRGGCASRGGCRTSSSGRERTSRLLKSKRCSRRIRR